MRTGVMTSNHFITSDWKLEVWVLFFFIYFSPLFIYFFVCSFIQQILGACYVPDTVLGTGEEKTKIPVFMKLIF